MRERQRTVQQFQPAVDGLEWCFPKWLPDLAAAGYRPDHLPEPMRQRVVMALRARQIAPALELAQR